MGRKKYLDKVVEFINTTSVFRSKDIEKIIGNKEYAQLTLHLLSRRGFIHRLQKDCYSRYGDPTLTVYCFKPAYIGLQEALSLHGLWEQETITIIITVRKVRVGIRNILGNNVLIKRIHPKYFFGIELLEYNGLYIPISDIEKTIIDMIYFNQPIDKEIYQQAKRKINKEKLEKYINKYPPNIKKKIRTKLGKNLGMN